jgi:hypothetical protein
MSIGMNGQMLPRVWGDGNYQVRTENFVEGASNGIQTFFMTAEEVSALNKRQCKKYGMVDFETLKEKKYKDGKWVLED